MAMARKRDGRSKAKLKCPSCNKSYRYLKHLKRHQLWHTGQRPFECDVCTASFSRSDCLKRHRRSCVHRHEAGLPPIEQKFSQQKPHYLLPQQAGAASPSGIGSDSESADGPVSTTPSVSAVHDKPRRDRRLRASTLRQSYADDRDPVEKESATKPIVTTTATAEQPASGASMASSYHLSDEELDTAGTHPDTSSQHQDTFEGFRKPLKASLATPVCLVDEQYNDCSTTNISSTVSSPLIDSSFNSSIETAATIVSPAKFQHDPVKYEDCIEYDQEALANVTEWLHSPERHQDEVFTPPACYSGDFGINDPYFQSFVKPSPEPVIRVDDRNPAQYNACSELSGAMMAYETPTSREDVCDNSSGCAFPQDSNRYDSATVAWTVPFYSHSSLYH